MRDMEKYLAEYQELLNQNDSYNFYPSEIEKIYSMTTEKWEAVGYAFAYAFVVGYKAAKEEG